MFKLILEYLKHPVTTLIQKSDEEEIKKGAIKTLIISVITSIVTVIARIQLIYSMYSENSFYGSYGEDGLRELRNQAMKDANLFGLFFKSVVIYIIAIAIIAAMLFVIAKLIKSEKKYSSTLSMVNNSLVVCVAGYIINMIVSLLYEPLGLVIFLVTTIYASYSLIYAFKDSLGDVDVDKLVLITTAIMAIVTVILAIVISNVISSYFNGLISSLNKFM